MHMADALISPLVGGTMWAAAAGVAAYSLRKVQAEMDNRKIPLMGVAGAFIFAAQMINFSIPATGASGHLGGGLILAILLGPYAGFLAMASVLAIQALFFADGGLLAYGCNLLNLGFFTCFLAYPLLYKRIMRKGYSAKRILGASMLTAIIGLQLGAFGVVLETLFSGKTELPFSTFVLLMQPVHLAIGITEGLVTAAIVTFIWKTRPEILDRAAAGRQTGNVPLRQVLIGFALAAVLAGAVLSWFASANPDGLEWSMLETAGMTELAAPDGIHQALAGIQRQTAFLPDYGFKAGDSAENSGASRETNKGGTLQGSQEIIQGASQGTAPSESEAAWPAVSAGTSVAGLVGAGMTLGLAALIGLGISLLKKKQRPLITSVPGSGSKSLQG
ncbi:MAG TPA: energy-coupling factor ABC transporter permease [Desulfitobacteriaceae bacterium]|nr:energy-coupling factor ABC transporter permease [Desulfitobacteriaceae bacterium]